MTVTAFCRGARVMVTAQRQPTYPALVAAKKWVTTRSSSAWPPEVLADLALGDLLGQCAARGLDGGRHQLASALRVPWSAVGMVTGDCRLTDAGLRESRRRRREPSGPARRRSSAGQDGRVHPEDERPAQQPPRRPSAESSRPDYGQAGHLAGQPTGPPGRPSAERSGAADAGRKAAALSGRAAGGAVRVARRAIALGRGRRVRALPAARAPRLQRRRRLRAGDLAGRHPVLRGPERRGPRPDRAVPRHHDAAVRGRWRR